jgi:hypothetical protein
VLENTLSVLCYNVLIGTVEVMLIEPLLMVMLGLKDVLQSHWSVGSAVLRENELMAISKIQVYLLVPYLKQQTPWVSRAFPADRILSVASE